jgi:hypothetical protein
MAAVHLVNDPTGFACSSLPLIFAGALAAFLASRSASMTEARFWLGVSLLSAAPRI